MRTLGDERLTDEDLCDLRDCAPANPFISKMAAELLALRAENERLRGDVKLIETSFTEVCDVLGCAYDNEAALMAAKALSEPPQ